MGLFSEYRKLISEEVGEHHKFHGTDYSARIVPTKGGMHIAKFFKNDVHMSGADYGPYDYDDVRGFVDDEKEFRTKEAKKAEDGNSNFKMPTPDQEVTDVEDASLNKKSLEESKLPPEGHRNMEDPIAASTEGGDGIPNKTKPKKMSGNHTPVEIIARILAGM